jgi:hypothetical protein
MFEAGLRWLVSLWEAPAQERTASATWETEQMDKGLGVDPNGGATTAGPPPPVEVPRHGGA